MFKLIEPKHYPYYRGRTDLLVGLMQLSQDISLSYEEQACSTFVVGEEDAGTVFGGAILNERHVNTLPVSLQKAVSASVPHMDYVWTGTLALCIENEQRGSGFARLFYRNLLKQLDEFGHQEDIGFLSLTLNPREYLRTKDEGFWPYVSEITPSKSSDGLFHGVLALSARKAKVPVRPWEMRETLSPGAFSRTSL
jgi:hypothetical protein